MGLTSFRLRDEEGTAEATVISQGGTINNFVAGGEAVFYERCRIGEKVRGGCHICAPWFGPVLSPQHGYLRDLLGAGTG